MAVDARLAATTTFEDAIGKTWDVLVVGAGPAGAIAARQTALRGARVLLVDRGQFPRAKVCGCCLNAAGWKLLKQIGLGHLPCLLAAPAVTEFRLACRGRQATLPIERGLAVSREFLDTDLIRAAIAAGAEFLDCTQVVVESVCGDARQVRLQAAHTRGTAAARVVIVAAGLAGRHLAEPASESRTTSPTARIGVAAMLDAPDDDSFLPGTIFMACNGEAYVGIVRLADGRLDVAAAMDAAAVQRFGSVAGVVETTVRESGLPVPVGLAAAAWCGTPKLTHHRKVLSDNRCFVIGDAAAYVEPFTGEGISWALASGRAVAPLVLQASRGDPAVACAAWNHTHGKLLGPRMRRCWMISRCLRYPRLVHAAVGLLTRRPGLARPIVWSLNAEFATPGSQVR